jgi:hypothetical protein
MTSSAVPSARRAAPLLIGCAAVLALAAGAAVRFRVPLRALGAEGLQIDTRLIPELERFASRPDPRAPAIAFLGDSLMLCEGVTVGGALARQRAAAPPMVVELRHGALRPIQYVALIDGVLAGRPEAVVVEINFRLMSETAYLAPGLRMPQVTRRLTLRRAWAVRAALAADGLTLLDPLLYRLQARLGLLYVADGVRELVRRKLELAGDAVTTAVGRPSRFPPISVAEGDALARRSVQREYTGDRRAAATALAEVRRTARTAGIPILFYVSPLNLSYLEKLGVLVAFDPPAAVEQARLATGAEPGEWLDLHAEAPAAAFRDEVGHLHAEGCRIVARAIDDALRRRGL